jgi:hypothetical protein
MAKSMKPSGSLKTTGNARKEINSVSVSEGRKPGLPGIKGKTEASGIPKQARRKVGKLGAGY